MKNESLSSLRPVGIYLLITLALSSVFYFLIISKGSLSGGRGTFVTGLMWCPGMSAILTSLILNRKLSLLGWQWGRTRFQLLSYLVPLMYSLIAYIIIWFTGFGKFYNTEFVENLESIFGFRKLPDLLSVLVCFILIGLFALPVSCATALEMRSDGAGS
ncbi:hypothetical protein [Pollutibacter soli]|uniref:hypothetical protein n=1 Tax=Pollutibacter soli TaxID=3034157 RepID=UPI0030141B9A